MKKILLFLLGAVYSGLVIGSGVSFPSTYQAGNVAITGGAINGVAIGAVTPGTITGTAVNATSIGATTPGTITGTTVAATGAVTGASVSVTGDANAASTISLNGKMIKSATNPTLGSGWGTSPSILAGNGTSNFRVNVGTGGTASAGTINFPTATAAWGCTMSYLTGGRGIPVIAAYGATFINVTNTDQNGTVLAWASGQVIFLMCEAY